MSEVITDEPVVESNDAEIGLTSEETEKKSLLESITIYDTMLILSFVFVSLAALRLFFSIRTYSGSFPLGGFPWRANEFLNTLFLG